MAYGVRQGFLLLISRVVALIKDKESNTYLPSLLKEDADQSTASFVDNTAKGIAKPLSGFLGHVGKLCVDPFVDQLIKRLPEHIRFPNGTGAFLELLQHIADQLLGLLLGSYDRVNLGLNIGADHMNRGGGGL